MFFDFRSLAHTPLWNQKSPAWTASLGGKQILEQLRVMLSWPSMLVRSATAASKLMWLPSLRIGQYRDRDPCTIRALLRSGFD